MVYRDVRTMSLYLKKFVTVLYTASHKTPTNDHFRRNSDCMWLMTFIAGFPIQASNIYAESMLFHCGLNQCLRLLGLLLGLWLPKLQDADPSFRRLL